MRHMVVFSRVVEAGSISAAAEDLDISKSVVSQQLKSLEAELGVVLLKRTTRQQILTPVGKAFYLQCQKINQLTQKAWDDARDSQIEPTGSISVNAPHALIEPVISPAVGAMVNRYNKIVPTILANDQRVDLIEKGVDLAIRVGEMPSSEYRQRLVGQFREVLCASPDYIREKNLSAVALLKDPEVAESCDYVANTWQGKNINHELSHKNTGKKGTVTFHANRFNDSLSSVIAMVKAGAGIALIPDFLFYPCQQKHELENIFSDYLLPSVPVYSVHAFGSNPPLNVKLAIDFIKSQMSAIT
ncbi:LysR family transcriptional regulator [Aliikangiella coralliicola]|uniref:LysR family transcriptional regulator n=1 Tax=Aliikangiella coralliicola TaxID=2592383 RepID=A0A545UK69_9GAMM|nr:LysR family transcriptional regulator [Aliikangiella coralliicola]